jgi:carbon monoxide dehydrogenase subunit G
MELTQTRSIAAPPPKVWAALNDPEILKACLPGCETLERISDTELKAVIAARIGPVQSRFTGRVQLADMNPPTSYTLRFEGQGGAAGFANGEARVSLAPEAGDATALTYTASARVGGKIAQLGSRLIDGVAAKLADDFFGAFAQRVGRPAAGGTEASGQVAPSSAVSSTAPQRAGSGRRIAVIALIVVALVLIYWLVRR